MRCWTIIKSIYVEPIILSAMLGVAVYRISQAIGFYQLICELYYHSTAEVTCITGDLKRTKWAEDKVQAESAHWNTYAVVCYMVPGIAAGMILGAWGDEVGRKVNILIGTLGTVVGNLGYILVMANRDIPIYLVLGMDILSGCTGFMSIVFVSSMALVVDTNTDDADGLTFRMILMTVAMQLGFATGSALAGALAASVTMPMVGAIGIAIVCFGALYAAVRIPQLPPMELKRRCLIEAGVDPFEAAKRARRPRRRKFTISDDRSKSLVVRILLLLKETLKAYVKPREGHKRAFLLLIILVFIVLMTAEAGAGMVTNIYVQKYPLEWGPTYLGNFTAITTALSLVGTLVGGFVLKKVIRARDTTLILIGIFLHIVKMIMEGLACLLDHEGATIMMFATTGLILKSVGGGAISAFIAGLVEPDEVGKVMTATGLSMELGILLGAVVYSPIYAATVSWFPGFVHMLAALQLLICFIITLWIHFKSKSLETKAKVEENGIGLPEVT